MSLKRKRREAEVDPFYDMLFNILIAFVFCFIVALLAMNPEVKKKKGDVPAHAEFIITVTWPDNDPNDVDTWVEDPGGNLVYFQQPQSGLMHLDRDDRGISGDIITVNGREITNPLNQEVVTVRGFAPGEYTVNVQYYDTKDDKPVDVSISIVKVNPVATVVFYGTIPLPTRGTERTAARFTVDESGSVINVNTQSKNIAKIL